MATAQLGDLYERNGKYKNQSMSIKLIKKSADQGCAHGLFLLGKAYLKGYGGLQSFEKCVQYTRLAAESGHAGALGNMGC